MTLDKSAKTSLRLFEKDRYDRDEGEGQGGWKNMLMKFGRPLTCQQFEVLKSLHAWRDTKARQTDESVR